MASSIHPLRDLYIRLNSQLGKEEETKIRNLLTGIQIPKRDIEKLKDPAAIFLYLEERGHIGENDLRLLRDILEHVNRTTLIQTVAEYEAKVKTYAGITQTITTRPLYCGGHDTDIVYRCRYRLQETYQKWSNITPFPWCDGTDRLKLEDVYTELELQAKDKRNIRKAEMFTSRNARVPPRRILVEGDPGCGKTTLCKKLAFDWASEENVDLNRFKLLFFLELRDVFEYHRNNPDKQCLIDVISDLYLDFCDQDKSYLWNYIQSNQSEICIVFDGLDEVPVQNLPKYFKEVVREKFSLLKNSVVVVTSRKVRDKNSKQSYDTQLCIKGLDEVALEDFVQKHIRATQSNDDPCESLKIMNISHLVDLLYDKPDKYILSDVTECPLMALMLWSILMKNRRHCVSKTDFYTVSSLVDMLVKWHLHKIGICEDQTTEESTRMKHRLSKIAFNCLNKDSSTVNNEDISNYPNVLNVGLLTIESKPFLSECPRYKFIHATFQEYLAAEHVKNLYDNDPAKFSEITEEYWMRGNITFLKFLAGALGDDVNKLFEALSGSDYFNEQTSNNDDDLDNKSNECYHFDCSAEMLFDILFESGTKRKDSFDACVALMPKLLTLNVDKISKYDLQKLRVFVDLISHSIMRFDEVILQKNVMTMENNYALFKNLMPKKLNDSGIKRILSANSNTEGYVFMPCHKMIAIIILTWFCAVQRLLHCFDQMFRQFERRKSNRRINSIFRSDRIFDYIPINHRVPIPIDINRSNMSGQK
ncbi:NLR family CARD domain-containing protein 4-like [Ptychodera flava]|uniref:NLR family CARD domain-containing protein 4-like n=1 Tax=Ptychodera flava TaxID=63121 RepID=UPI00396AAF20